MLSCVPKVTGQPLTQSDLHCRSPPTQAACNPLRTTNLHMSLYGAAWGMGLERWTAGQGATVLPCSCGRRMRLHALAAAH